MAEIRGKKCALGLFQTTKQKNRKNTWHRQFREVLLRFKRTNKFEQIHFTHQKGIQEMNGKVDQEQKAKFDANHQTQWASYALAPIKEATRIVIQIALQFGV